MNGLVTEVATDGVVKNFVSGRHVVKIIIHRLKKRPNFHRKLKVLELQNAT